MGEGDIKPVLTYDPNDLRSLEDRSSRPRQPRRPTWSLAQAEAVQVLREAHPRWGKDKLQPVLGQRGVRLSVSMVGRILADLKRRRGLAEPGFLATWFRSTPCT